VAVSVGWVRLCIKVNAAANQALFYVNDTLVATHTTNIPATAGRSVGFGAGIFKSVGTTSILLNADYVNDVKEMTVSR